MEARKSAKGANEASHLLAPAGHSAGRSSNGSGVGRPSNVSNARRKSSKVKTVRVAESVEDAERPAKKKPKAKKRSCGERITALRKKYILFDDISRHFARMKNFVYNTKNGEIFGWPAWRWFNVFGMVLFQSSVVMAMTTCILGVFPTLHVPGNRLEEFVPTIMSQLPIGVVAYPRYMPQGTLSNKSNYKLHFTKFPFKTIYLKTSNNNFDDGNHEKIMKAYLNGMAGNIKIKPRPQAPGDMQPLPLSPEDLKLEGRTLWRYQGWNWQVTEYNSDEDFKLNFNDANNPCAEVSASKVQENADKGSFCAYFTLNRINPLRCFLADGDLNEGELEDRKDQCGQESRGEEATEAFRRTWVKGLRMSCKRQNFLEEGHPWEDHPSVCFYARYDPTVEERKIDKPGDWDWLTEAHIQKAFSSSGFKMVDQSGNPVGSSQGEAEFHIMNNYFSAPSLYNDDQAMGKGYDWRIVQTNTYSAPMVAVHFRRLLPNQPNVFQCRFFQRIHADGMSVSKMGGESCGEDQFTTEDAAARRLAESSLGGFHINVAINGTFTNPYSDSC